MGCCTEPYLGFGVQSCSGISVDAACTGLVPSPTQVVPSPTQVVPSPTQVVSSAAVLAAPVFMMIFALIGFLA